jgi:hypothetical protein
VDVGLPVDGTRDDRGMNDRAGDAADGKAENAKDRHQRQPNAKHNHCVGDRRAKWRFRIARGPEVAMGGDYHRRVDDNREGSQCESIRSRRPLFSEQERHECRRGTRERREQRSGEDHRGGQESRQHAGWIPAGGLGPGHRRKGHAQQRHQQRLWRLERSQDEAPVGDNRDASDRCCAQNQYLVAECYDEVDRLDT